VTIPMENVASPRIGRVQRSISTPELDSMRIKL
jgi:hypothetical protein